MQHMLLT